MKEAYINNFVEQAADMQGVSGVLFIFAQIQAGLAESDGDIEASIHAGELLSEHVQAFNSRTKGWTSV